MKEIGKAIVVLMFVAMLVVVVYVMVEMAFTFQKSMKAENGATPVAIIDVGPVTTGITPIVSPTTKSQVKATTVDAPASRTTKVVSSTAVLTTEITLNDGPIQTQPPMAGPNYSLIIEGYNSVRITKIDFRGGTVSITFQGKECILSPIVGHTDYYKAKTSCLLDLGEAKNLSITIFAHKNANGFVTITKSELKGLDFSISPNAMVGLVSI